MDTAALHIPSLGSASDVKVLRYDLPLARAGEAVGASGLTDASADHQPGNLRVRIIEAEGLASRADGSACEPFVTVAVAELTRRRTRRTAAASRGPNVKWGQAFDFEGTSACAQVVVDVWDRPAEGPADLLGKAVLSLSECRVGVPHTYFKHLLEGKLVSNRSAVPCVPVLPLCCRRARPDTRGLRSTLAGAAAAVRPRRLALGGAGNGRVRGPVRRLSEVTSVAAVSQACRLVQETPSGLSHSPRRAHAGWRLGRRG